MKRIFIPLAAVAALALPAAGIAVTQKPTLKLAKTTSGKILVNSRGFTVYIFTKDHRNQDRCVTIPMCKGTWPPLTIKGKVTWGAGVKKSLLGTIKLTGGAKQITYSGHPLYLYSGDLQGGGPADTGYIGFPEFGGTWYAINGAGKAVKK